MTKEQAIEKVLSLARSQVGYTEVGDNQTKYAQQFDYDSRLYGFDMNGLAWCDYFVDWLFIHCFGFEIGSAMLYQYAGCAGAACANSAQYFRNNGAFFSTPEVGDQIFFYYSGAINHTGIVESVNGNTVVTIEGNSSDGVRRNTYNLSNSIIAGYGRPRWKYADAAKEDASAEELDAVCVAISEEPDLRVGQNVLKFGSVGYLVTALQSILNYYGSDLDMDGEFGRLTQDAVYDYQKTHKDAEGKPLEADGIVGEKTWGSF